MYRKQLQFIQNIIFYRWNVRSSYQKWFHGLFRQSSSYLGFGPIGTRPGMPAKKWFLIHPHVRKISKYFWPNKIRHIRNQNGQTKSKHCRDKKKMFSWTRVKQKKLTHTKYLIKLVCKKYSWEVWYFETFIDIRFGPKETWM